MEFDARSFVTIVGSITASGGFVLWFAKVMARRLIAQYDKKHEEHEKRHQALADKMSDSVTELKLAIARLEPMVAAAMTIRGDLKSAQDNLAVLKHIVGKTNQDLNKAYSEIRSLQKNTII